MMGGGGAGAGWVVGASPRDTELGEESSAFRERKEL